ncbi:S ribonuclease [Pyrus ussuriensis x Pyrus communis]|uniref:S ribonuclease n=1 Tax=Pyrus ussuriensis x Pyrus communis TaxID=2448454 RepID=A0A5N5HMR6_9ROSA|nr:S ribonuclease [Pyrus ussuriensis x Pyrus communis]
MVKGLEIEGCGGGGAYFGECKVEDLQLVVVVWVGCGGVGVDFEVGFNLIWNLEGWWFEVESFEVREKKQS